MGIHPVSGGWFRSTDLLVPYEPTEANMSQTRFLCATPLLYTEIRSCLVPTNANIGFGVFNVYINQNVTKTTNELVWIPTFITIEVIRIANFCSLLDSFDYLPDDFFLNIITHLLKFRTCDFLHASLGVSASK